MSDADTRIDFSVAAAGHQAEDGEAEGESVAPPAPTTSIPSKTPRPAWPSLTSCWRGMFTLSLGLTLCAIAVAESTGAAKAPAWFLGFAIPVLTEWVGEWVVWGRRKGA